MVYHLAFSLTQMKDLFVVVVVVVEDNQRMVRKGKRLNRRDRTRVRKSHTKFDKEKEEEKRKPTSSWKRIRNP